MLFSIGVQKKPDRDNRKGTQNRLGLQLSMVSLVKQSWKNLSGIGRPQVRGTARPKWVKKHFGRSNVVLKADRTELPKMRLWAL